MKTDNSHCVRCDETERTKTIELYGFIVCNSCKSKFGLLQDKTISRHHTDYDQKKSVHPSFESEVNYKLDQLEQAYVRKKIKLLHIQERLKHLK